MDAKLTNVLQQEIMRRNLPGDFLKTIEVSYMPVAEQIAYAQRNRQDTLLVSFNGAQGSGKSTITAF